MTTDTIKPQSPAPVKPPDPALAHMLRCLAAAAAQALVGVPAADRAAYERVKAQWLQEGR